MTALAHLRRSFVLVPSVFLLFLLACGGDGHSADPIATGPTQTGDEEPAEPTEPTEPEEPAEPEEPEATGPSHEGVQPEDADALRAALVEASSNEAAFYRLIDPEVGLGSFDTSESARGHYCDVMRMPQESALGFTIREDFQWRCDGEMRRCSAKDPHDNSGFVFFFRRNDAGALHLETIVRYGRRVPRRDSDSIIEFADATEGVCDLWRALRQADSLSPAKFSIFESRFTDRVESESTRRHHCGDDAQRIIREQLGPLIQTGPPAQCSRSPLSCSWFEDDEIRVLGRDGNPWGVAYLALDLSGGRPRLQNAEVDAFVLRARRHSCSD